MQVNTPVDKPTARSRRKLILGIVYAAVLLGLPAIAVASFYPWSFLDAPAVGEAPEVGVFTDAYSGPGQPPKATVQTGSPNASLNDWEDAGRIVPPKKKKKSKKQS